jgi:PAS domain S-box-containing protein
LGFDRLSIWLVDEDDPDYMFGAYGTDEHGKLRDERRVRIKLPQSEAFRDVLSGHIPHYIWEDTPLHNHNHEVVGTGWNATTVLWGDDRGIGWLSADNLIHGRPATPQLLELLSLYGSTLGHLIRRKRSQDALLGSEERFRALYRDNPSMFFTLDMDGTIISVNEFGAQQLGYAIDELEGQSMLTVYHDDDKASVQAQLKHCVANPGQIFEWDLRNVRKDGSVLWVEKFARAVKSPTNELHILTVCQDITERKLAEQQRLELAVEREKVGFLQGFLGSMAHDLKTPAAGIEMNLAILDGLTDSDDAKRWIEMMNKQLEDLTTIINDVLTIARLETLPDLFFESVNINQLIVDIQMSLQSRITTKGLTLNLALDDNLPVVHASRDELYRALMNLLENAIKYTPEQGTVSIRTSSSDSQVMAEISDSGIGISESHLSRIFDEFYRAENGRAFASGTGLGLAITKKIIDLHQGTIVVESIVGEGTTFRISLPEMA